MKKQLIKLAWVLSAFFAAAMLLAQDTFAQTAHTPYPIIFIHGLNSCDTTWGKQDNKFDNIIDYLEGAGLTFGGKLDISLSHARSTSTLSVAKEQDVHLFTTRPGAGDFYTINFDVNISDKYPIVHRAYSATTHSLGLGDSIVLPPVILNPTGISSTASQILVNYPEEFLQGDIIAIDNEFMSVLSIAGNTVTVNRPLFGSLTAKHDSSAVITNLSNESNQASVAKQGYGLKLAIDAIKSVTHATKVILVGHSLGGLAAREYIRNYSQNDVAKIITIGTPHYGANISDLPNPVMGIFGIDGFSDAVRDLRASIPEALGVYLFGGQEGELNGYYYSSDVNANGVTTDFIDGLNSSTGYASLQNIAHTWIASNYPNKTTPILGPNDGVVLTSSEYIYSGDSLMTNKVHTSEPTDYFTLLRGLDEPSDPSTAYQISPNSTTRGFITFGQFNDPVDIDLFKVVLPVKSALKIVIGANSYTGIKKVNLLDSAQNFLTGNTNYNLPITATLAAGTYYIQIRGIASSRDTLVAVDTASFNYPYTLTTTTTPVPLPTISASPAKLSYYDVVLNQSVAKTITLTNNGTSALSISNLTIAGANASQFSITGPTSYSIPGGQTQIVAVNFKPTSAGTKYAQLMIANSSSDNPQESIPLRGNGTASATRKLVVQPDSSYNFGNQTITVSKAEAFNIIDTGSSAINISGLRLIGPNASEFSISTQSGTPFNVDPNGGSTLFVANFLPATVGSKSAQLVLSNNSNNKTPADTINLYGNGTNSIYTGIGENIVYYEYWFDSNYASKVGVSITPQNLAYLNTNIPASGLITGSHVLNIRYKDQNGKWSSVETQNFYKEPLAPSGTRNIVELEYWFDGNYAAKVDSQFSPTPISAISTNLNTAALAVGTHILNLRYKDDIGEWSSVVSSTFSRAPLAPTANRNIVELEYWFDGNYSTKADSTFSPTPVALISASLHTQTIGVGTHTVNMRYKDDIGQWSSVVSSTFSRAPLAPTGTRNIVQLEYWYDSNYAAKRDSEFNPAPIAAISANLNTTALTVGTHTVNMRYKDDIGQWSSVVSSTFSRAPLASSTTRNLVSYEYWFDSNYAAKVTVPLSPSPTAGVNSNIPTASLTAGTHRYNVRFKDNQGQWSSVVTDTVTVLSKVATLSSLKMSKGIFSPVFASGATSYTDAVGNTVTSVTVTPTTTDPTATIKVNGTAVTSGTASGALPLNVGPNTITTVVTAQDGGTTQTYTVMVTRAPSSIDNLSLLKMSGGVFSPVFSSGTTSYTDAVGNAITSVTVTPTTADPTAMVKVNGNAVISGTASRSINLTVGANNITVTVTAQDGKTAKTYTVTVTRAPSANDNLSSLKISKGIFSPTFVGTITSYADAVGNTISSVTVTPTVADPTATVKVNGNAVTSGTASKSINVAVGSNKITVTVTAQDGATTQTYTITVTRAGNNNDNLTSLKMSKGTFSPAFASGTTSYTDAVANTITSVTVTPTASDPGATIQVNGTTVASGTALAAINLAVGANTINVVVTAQDGTTTKTYAVTVTRAGNANDNLTSLKMSKGIFSPAFASATTSYADAVGNTITAVTVTPTASDPDATIKVNGTAVASGTASTAINMAVGANTINVVVTASDKATTKTYTVTVTRASGGADSFSPGLSVTQPTETPALVEDGIQVHQGVSPNGDGINDFLQIDNIAQYPDNKLMIMNRNGQLIYEAKGYDNSSKVFDGHSNKNGQMQLPGTYFYQLDYTVSGVSKHKTGFIVLKY